MYYFIINPNSRSGEGFHTWKAAEELLRERALEYEAYFTEGTGHASRLARQIAALSLPCTLTVVGGDGTLNEVANGLADTEYSHITLGYIPTGSGNDFARGLGLSCDVKTCIDSILSPREIVSVDLGLSRTREASRYFLVSSGIGYDADICRNVTASPLKKLLNRLHLGKLTYAAIALGLLFRYDPCPVCVRLDKKKTFSIPRYFFITGMIQKYEGGGVKFCPYARYDDGLLDFCIAGNLAKAKILFLFPTAFAGKHTDFSGVHILRGKRLDIISQAPLPIHCDGESMGCSSHLTLYASDKKLPVILR